MRSPLFNFMLSFTPPESLELRGMSGRAKVTWRRNDDGTIAIESFDGCNLEEASEPTEQGETMEREMPEDAIDDM